MPSKFGGVPVEETPGQSKFGGIAVESPAPKPAAAAPSTSSRIGAAATDFIPRGPGVDPRQTDPVADAARIARNAYMPGGIGEPWTSHAEDQAAREPYEKGSLLNAVHAIPFVGPMAAGIGHDIQEKNYPEAIGHGITAGLGALGLGAGPGPEEGTAGLVTKVRSPLTMGKPSIPYIPGTGIKGHAVSMGSRFRVQNPVQMMPNNPIGEPSYRGNPSPVDTPPPAVNVPRGRLPSGRTAGPTSPANPPQAVLNPRPEPSWRANPSPQVQPPARVSPISSPLSSGRTAGPAAPVAPIGRPAPIWQGLPEPTNTPPPEVTGIPAAKSIGGRLPGAPDPFVGPTKPLVEDNTITNPKTALNVDMHPSHAAAKVQLADDLYAHLAKNKGTHAGVSQLPDDGWEMAKEAVRPGSPDNTVSATTRQMVIERFAKKEGVNPAANPPRLGNRSDVGAHLTVKQRAIAQNLKGAME